MRRISATHAKPGMVLGRPVYDAYGYEVVERGTKINEKVLQTLGIQNVGEVIVDDWRVYDVPVQALLSPEHEGRATQALRTILVESQGRMDIEEVLLEEAEDPIFQMTRELFPEVIGEINASGCYSLKDYHYVQATKTAGLCLLMGRRLGISLTDLAMLGLAGLFKDIGMVALPAGIMDRKDPTEAQQAEIRKHPLYGAKIIGMHDRFDPAIVKSIAFHHERWDGSGYPKGLKKEEIPIESRIIAIADTYYEMVSKRPDHVPYMPHEAVEYIMAYAGELFDPKLVQLFSRQVPLYPTGITVKLNTGEMGIISDSNLGLIGRPTVRICFDERGHSIKEPYDRNLAEVEFQAMMIEQVLDY